MADFQERIEQAAARARELEGQMADPEIAKQPGQMQKLVKELGRLRPLVETGERYQGVVTQIADARAMANEDDAEMAELARAELEELETERGQLEDELTELAAGPRRRALEATLRPLMAFKPDDRPASARGVAQQLLEASALPMSEKEGAQLLSHLQMLARREGGAAEERLQTHPLAQALLAPA